MERIDLHIHTTASDGTDAPADAVRLAAQAGVTTLAICDHDTTAGIAEARAAGAALGVRVLPGVEFSASWQGGEVHLLGYGFDPAAAPVEACCAWCREERVRRNRAMAQRLTALGHPVDYDALASAHLVVGRPHIAQALVDQGAAASIPDAFSRFLSPGRPGYVPRRRLPLAELAAAIRESGGVAVLAHPMHYRLPEPEVRRMVQCAQAAGVEGLEVYYAGNTPAETAFSAALARELGLLETGGSDYHGACKPGLTIGMGSVPPSLLEPLLSKITMPRMP